MKGGYMDQETKEILKNIESRLARIAQKDIEDIKAHLKLTHEVIDRLDCAKVDHLHLKPPKGIDKENRELLDKLRLRYQKSMETLLKIGINPKERR